MPPTAFAFGNNRFGRHASPPASTDLAAAAARDAIAVKVELDPAPRPRAVARTRHAAADLRDCAPPISLQLTRAQLGDLGTAAGAHPNLCKPRPGPWRHAALLADLNARAAVAEAEALARSSGARWAARPARPDAPSGLSR